MRILIFLLALTSAFFVSAEPDMNDLVSPKQVPIGKCGLLSGLGPTVADLDGESCVQYIRGVLEPKSYVNRIDDIWIDGDQVWFTGRTSGSETTFRVGFFRLTSSTRTCPPDLHPNHIIPVGEGDSLMCAKELAPKDCPAGYHSKAVSKSLGSTECVPKQCPPAGTGENLASTPMTGGVPFSGGGMYCNDGCAYSVNAEQISSEKYAVGTSQGLACGDKPYDNKKLADEGDTGGCLTDTNGEVDLMICPNANPTTPETDPHNNDDSKVGEEDTPEKPKETCADGDAACNLKNVETQIENSSNKIIDNDNELHNKKIDADTKNTQAILNTMESVDTSILLQTSQDELLHAVTVSKFNELIDAVNGLESGGSGGGAGDGDGGGDGEGDCDPSITDCVPIENSEIPTETVNLEQYADQYDDWLPDAELPQEKCITLTTGLSTCFSFEAFILLFQGISGLIVIGALMHSARIIAGAV